MPRLNGKHSVSHSCAVNTGLHLEDSVQFVTLVCFEHNTLVLTIGVSNGSRIQMTLVLIISDYVYGLAIIHEKKSAFYYQGRTMKVIQNSEIYDVTVLESIIRLQWL